MTERSGPEGRARPFRNEDQLVFRIFIPLLAWNYFACYRFKNSLLRLQKFPVSVVREFAFKCVDSLGNWSQSGALEPPIL
jgi:hypothetical protein